MTSTFKKWINKQNQPNSKSFLQKKKNQKEIILKNSIIESSDYNNYYKIINKPSI